MSILVINQTQPSLNGVYHPTRQIKVAMSYLPEKWDAENSPYKWFTVGKGKRRYHIWTCGPCGLHYCYHIGEDGRASCRRAVEPGQEVTLHVADDSLIAHFINLPGDSPIIPAGTWVALERVEGRERRPQYVIGVDPALPDTPATVTRIIQRVELTSMCPISGPSFRVLSSEDLPPQP